LKKALLTWIQRPKIMNQYFTSSVGDGKLNVKVQFDEESEEALPTGKKTIKQVEGDNEVEEKDDEIILM